MNDASAAELKLVGNAESEPVDLSDFENIHPRPSCWFQRLTPEQQEKTNAAHETGYGQRVIAQVVTGWGVPIKRTIVSAHFTKECGCYKK